MLTKLVPFGGHQPVGIRGIDVALARGGHSLQLTYTLFAEINEVRLPSAEPRTRRDELWRHTCFEIFMAAPDGYREYNFSPSTAWAAYDFTTYRQGMRPAGVEAPEIRVSRMPRRLEMVVEVAILDGCQKIGLSAVIENSAGVPSYWALRHAGEKPDFHNPESFILTLDEAA